MNVKDSGVKEPPKGANGKPLPPPNGKRPPEPPKGPDGKPLPPPKGKDGRPMPPPDGKRMPPRDEKTKKV